VSAWSLTKREKRRLKVTESKFLRRIFELGRFKLTGGWRKLGNEELLNLYSWTSIFRMKSRRMRWEGHVALMEEKKSIYRFGVKARTKRTTGKS
jgi:hypothetical protein